MFRTLVMHMFILVAGLLSVAVAQEAGTVGTGKNDATSIANTGKRPGVTITTLDSGNVTKKMSSETEVAAAADKSLNDSSGSASAQSAKLFVTSTPEAASVTMNNYVVGKTPVLCMPPSGFCRIGLSLPGYQPYRSDITVTGRLNDTLAVVLKPEIQKMENDKSSSPSNMRLIRRIFGGLEITSAIGCAVFYFRAYDYHKDKENASYERDGNTADSFIEAKNGYNQSKNMFITSFMSGVICGTGVVYTYVF